MYIMVQYIPLQYNEYMTDCALISLLFEALAQNFRVVTLVAKAVMMQKNLQTFDQQ